MLHVRLDTNALLLVPSLSQTVQLEVTARHAAVQLQRLLELLLAQLQYHRQVVLQVTSAAQRPVQSTNAIGVTSKT